MTPRVWVGSKHGRMLLASLDKQATRVIAQYDRLGCSWPMLLAYTRLVMEEQLLAHGKPGELPRSLVQQRRLMQAEGGLCQGFYEDMTKAIRLLCGVWLRGGVETVDHTVVTWQQVAAGFQRWRLREALRLRQDDGASLKKFDLALRNPR